ncbi:hypothetical protein F2Q69_00022578 [Brassica cretica]|uniref:Uncharacterized protein n=1 Tax=Brassica cretica TaxID=69181 RepID=A0A8S9Q6G0_BRACR|nr:hypothetical protein F2Q69_00022578 [Brassica cretica]
MLGKVNFLGISIDVISSEKGVLEYEPGSLLRMGGATPGSLVASSSPSIDWMALNFLANTCSK